MCTGIGEPCCLGSRLRSSYTRLRSSSQSASTCRSTMSSTRPEIPTTSPILPRCASASKRAGSGGTSPARWHPRLRLAASSGLLCYTDARFEPGRGVRRNSLRWAGNPHETDGCVRRVRYYEEVREVRYYLKAAHLSQGFPKVLDRGYTAQLLRIHLPRTP